MGSVQSGKTASMLGVSALALDHEVDILVVLAGTRISLWRQTYERLISQLDAGEGTGRDARRILRPVPEIALSDEQADLQSVYHMAPSPVRRRLTKRQPIIIVAMKQINHLHALARSLRTNVFDTVSELGRPFHMLVLDDEADDGSILDAVVEAGRDPARDDLKQIPRGIANLWEFTDSVPANLFATYIAYTATPQANLLQEDHNPLAPRDFLVSLRTPLDSGHVVDPSNPVGNVTAPRSSTYPEPLGMSAYYTGGEVFYHRSESAGLCSATTGNAEQDLGEAVRAFLVAGAVRLHRSRRLGPHSAIKSTFDTRDEAATATSPPHSMLYHPSASIQDHFRGAEDVLLWAGVADRGEARAMLESGRAGLPGSLVARMRSQEAQWEAWLEWYQSSARGIAGEFNLLSPAPFPDWPTTRHLLETEVIPGTRVAVVNSDPTADDRPEYAPSFDEGTQRWLPAHDLSTIFVSGNVMARGLTLEGLTTALFQRSSPAPFADTQMQMQRWFGYRGAYIELCRVFADRQQLSLFRAYHDIDEAVRIAITENMQAGAPDPAVLQGLGFLATGKIANLNTRPLSPGAKPFVRLVNSGRQPDPNAVLVASLFAGGASSDLVAGNSLRGRILDEPLTLTQAAEVLDGLNFEDYRPGRADNRIAEHWAQVRARVAAAAPLQAGDLYRAPSGMGQDDPVRSDCPYSIPAYMRLWDACLTRSVRGLFVTGQPGVRWSTANLTRKRQTQPRFWVGIRYGGGSPVNSGPLAALPFQIPTTAKCVEGGEMKTEWGSNNPKAGPTGYRGDEFFDYYHHNAPLPPAGGGTAWRPAGSDGLILFYVNEWNVQPHPSIAVGVCLPAGGPEQFAATKASALPI
ncbi:Z1 domain-containing protein [Ornithinimicrobium pratense]|nr:Z1 domain-containing protein [Ornithinimicrobium pratense]